MNNVHDPNIENRALKRTGQGSGYFHEFVPTLLAMCILAVAIVVAVFSTNGTTARLIAFLGTVGESALMAAAIERRSRRRQAEIESLMAEIEVLKAKQDERGYFLPQ
jgi:ABC-type transport system involved in cytochrome bd biosynthesis fused ATPase/permease subunit